eukprot:286698-Pelagomonas_calceolata.AAC.1
MCHKYHQHNHAPHTHTHSCMHALSITSVTPDTRNKCALRNVVATQSEGKQAAFRRPYSCPST